MSSSRYRIKEAFYTLQGEGAHAGRASVFCRFSKCNLWTGKEQNRANAICNFCDTDFVGTDGQNGGYYSRDDLVALISRLWPQKHSHSATPYIVCTGGEPLLQLDKALVDAFQQAGFEVAVETNGTLPIPSNIDWVCLSPKGTAEIVVQQCDELKLVYPQQDAMPERFQSINATHRFLQPLDISALQAAQLIARDSSNVAVTQSTVSYCLAHPEWKISLQTHKWLGID